MLPNLTLVWQDGSGTTAEVRLTIGSITSVATIEIAATAMVAAISALTDAVFIRQDITYRAVPEIGMLGAPGSNKFRAGVFIFQCTDDVSVGLVEVPSLLNSLFVTTYPGDGVDIDTTADDIVSFLSVLSDAGATNPFAVPLGNLIAAYRQSRV